ncbi:CHC2 zinc finger domain-containing protein [Vulcaniibacterium gelatinicum]|uniref:CHC2 zinc finger domain-containing protein n=1 Tax=Vulcaniibacterium gelatinicum TaxID=2598725 RepID=UPI0011CA3596|nr:CHC2 zinc finger domain-containing protein [Vulcaniibacterium gelatinicum]
MSRPKKTPRVGGLAGLAKSMQALYGNPEATPAKRGWQSPSLPRNWRDRLPDPAAYYGARVAKLGKPNAAGWAQGQCPFHDDRNASLSVHLSHARGGWRCTECGGGDLIGFHLRITGLGFVEAVRDLVVGVGR